LTASEFHARLSAIDALTAGKLLPPVQHPDTPVYPESRREVQGVGTPVNPMARRGRPPHESRSLL
jgi:hypothetical protein